MPTNFTSTDQNKTNLSTLCKAYTCVEYLGPCKMPPNFLLCFQNRLLFGRGTNLVGPHYRTYRRLARSVMGRRCHPNRNFIFTRCDPVCCDVWPNGTGAGIYDNCLWCNKQWRHILGNYIDNLARPVRYVLRLCHIGHL